MKKHSGELALFLAALVFGTSYVFLNRVSSHLEPFTVNTCRFLFGFLCVCPSFFIKDDSDRKQGLLGGFLISVVIYVATYLQQDVAAVAPSGKMGFITSMYVVLVPVFNFIFFKNKIRPVTAFSIVMAVLGLAVLCDVKDIGFSVIELKLLAVATLFSFEVLLATRFSKLCSPLKLTGYAFFFATVYNMVSAFVFETPDLGKIGTALPDLLVLGIVCSGLAYFLQFTGQKRVEPAVSSLIMSLESVVSVVAGYLFLSQKMTARELTGCLIMFIAIIICELSGSQTQNG